MQNIGMGVAASSALALPSLGARSSVDSFDVSPNKSRIRQSASRWCYGKIPLEELCAKGAGLGLQGIDLLEENEWEVPRRYGLVCSMG